MIKSLYITMAVCLSMMVIPSIVNAKQLITNAEADKLCSSYGSLAYRMMEARQRGVSLSAILKVTKGDYHRRLIMIAWETPRYSIPKNQIRE